MLLPPLAPVGVARVAPSVRLDAAVAIPTDEEIQQAFMDYQSGRLQSSDVEMIT